MRPATNSNRGNLSSSGGQPPGTSARPGSGRKVPGTARLRTGVAPSGPGTQAAQGIALSASVNVSDRPVTGHGVMGMKMTNQPTGRIVEDSAYYIGLLRTKIKEVNEETSKLRDEVEHQSKDNSQYTQLERRYETLVKGKETLEGQLADYNLALDKTRSATDPEDVHQMALHMAEKNRQTGQDLDRLFMQRKQRESETNQVEDQIDNIHKNIQKRINEMEPGRLRSYSELMMKQKELQDRLLQYESRLNDVNNQIHSCDADDKTNSMRKEYQGLEKTYQGLKKDCDALQEELDIASLDPKDAHNKFVARVNQFKQGTKGLEDRMAQMREDISNQRKALEELSTANDADTEDVAKYDLLVKRDQEMTSFIDSFDETRTNILQDQKQIQYMVVALLEHIGKGIEDSSHLPSPEALGEMESARQFKEKNLVTAQKTMESLVAEKKKREKELEVLQSSEPKLKSELINLKESMTKMKIEIEEFQDVDRLRREFNDTKARLQEYKAGYIKRRDTMRQQIQSISLEHETLKKSLNANEIARELDDTEKRIKHYERSIFELKEFVDTKTRETDYEHVKAMCLKLSDNLNTANVKYYQQNGFGGGQAKGW